MWAWLSELDFPHSDRGIPVHVGTYHPEGISCQLCKSVKRRSMVATFAAKPRHSEELHPWSNTPGPCILKDASECKVAFVHGLTNILTQSLSWPSGQWFALSLLGLCIWQLLWLALSMYITWSYQSMLCAAQAAPLVPSSVPPPCSPPDFEHPHAAWLPNAADCCWRSKSLKPKPKFTWHSFLL